MSARARSLPAWLGPVLSLSALALFAAELRQRPPFIDDAYISFRYAQNLVDGHGLVWNPGERVEGITNLLWTLCLAAGMAVGADAEALAHGLSLASGLVALALTFVTARAVLPPIARGLAGLAPWLVLSSVAFAAWARSGLETPMLAALSALLAFAVARARPWLGTLALALAIGTRPDAVLLAPPFIAFACAPPGPERPTLRAWLWAAFPHAAALSALLVALTAFRLAYYGVPLPNTFYAKVGGLPLHAGLSYVVDFLFAGVLLWLPFATAPVAPPARRLQRTVLGWLALYVVYSVWVGGDAFLHSRFFVGLLPGLAAVAVAGAGARLAERAPGAGVLGGACLLGFFGAAWLGQPTARLAYAGAALVAAGSLRTMPDQPRSLRRLALLCLLSGTLLAFSPRPRLQGERLFEDFQSLFPADRGRNARLAYVDRFNAFTGALIDRTAERIRAESPLPSPIAALAIGRIGYRVRTRIIDVLGLTEPAIARAPAPPPGPAALPGHQRANADYVLSQAPALLLIPREQRVALPALRQLLQHPGLARRYTYDASLPGFRRDPARQRP